MTHYAMMRPWTVFAAFTALLLTGAYFLLAAQMDCGGDWTYSVRCPPLTECMPLPGRVTCQCVDCACGAGGRCLPFIVSWVAQLKGSSAGLAGHNAWLSPVGPYGNHKLDRRNESVPIPAVCAVPKMTRMTEIVVMSAASGLRFVGNECVTCLGPEDNVTGALT